MYPTAITVLVALHKTAWDITASTRETPTRAMEFANRRDTNTAPAPVVSGSIRRQSTHPSFTDIGSTRTTPTFREEATNALLLEDVELQSIARTVGAMKGLRDRWIGSEDMG